MALFTVEVSGEEGVVSPASTTEIGVAQLTARRDLPAGRVWLVAEFTAEPVINPRRGRVKLAGLFVCDCEVVYRSQAALDEHCEARPSAPT
jgi:hypothetical protein